MLIQVSTPTSAAELRALYRRTKSYFARPAGARPAPAVMPTLPPAGPAPAPALPARFLATPILHSRAPFSGRATLGIVGRRFRIDPAVLAGPQRLPHLVGVRWIVMHICVEGGGWPAARAGRLLNRDHTTVLYGLRELAALMTREAALADEVANLTRQCVPDAVPAAREDGA